MFLSKNKGTIDALKAKGEHEKWMLRFFANKQRKKVCFVYLECKVQQDRYGWWSFKSSKARKLCKEHI